MIILRSFLFNFCYIFWTCLVGVIFWPTVFFSTDVIILVVGKIWARGLYFFLRIFCNLKLSLKGQENIPTSAAIFASKHQSTLETIMFHLLIHKPIYVLKQELLDIPIFGYYLKKMGMIAINRNGGVKSLKLLLNQVQEKIKQGYNIVIFPEGSRIAPGANSEYNIGIAAIYNLKAASIIPVALNTGCFWPKNSFLRNSGEFTIEFLPAISNDLSRDEFMEILKQEIEGKSNDLLK